MHISRGRAELTLSTLNYGLCGMSFLIVEDAGFRLVETGVLSSLNPTP